MKYFFLSIFFAVVLYGMPQSARATEVGFVPSSGIWFSKQTIAQGEAVKAYAVIINNAYPAVKADVAFYDNSDEVGTVKIERLEKEQARELWIQWTPSPGSHKITARFLRASVIAANGTETALDPSELNTIGESSFTAPQGSQVSGQGGAVLQGSVPVNSTPTSTLVQDANALAGDGVTVQVKKEGDKLVLSVLEKDSVASAAGDSLGNGKTVTVSSKNNENAGAQNISASSTIVERAKNTADTIIEKIKNVGATVRDAREITVRTIHSARDAAEQGLTRAEAVGQAAREATRNKIALAWGGFLAFIALAGVLSYARWRKYR